MLRKIFLHYALLEDGDEAGAKERRFAWVLKVLGGATPKRSALPVKLAKEESEETGKYGDPVGKKIIGVESGLHHSSDKNTPMDNI